VPFGGADPPAFVGLKFLRRCLLVLGLNTSMSLTLSPHQLVHALNWRYATKKFDPAKPIPAETWHALEQSLILAPSSIGLQPWRFVVVTDPAVKAQLVPASYRQTQAADCSHFVAFAVRHDLSADHVDRHIQRMVEVRGVALESLAKFRAMTMSNLDKARAAGTLDTWQTHQIYIALGQFMACAAVLGVDTCPMEGIEPAKYDEILGLAGTDFSTVVACAAGYRLDDDKYAVAKKVRFKAEDVIVRL
jgi:nitroreductase